MAIHELLSSNDVTQKIADLLGISKEAECCHKMVITLELDKSVVVEITKKIVKNESN